MGTPTTQLVVKLPKLFSNFVIQWKLFHLLTNNSNNKILFWFYIKMYQCIHQPFPFTLSSLIVLPTQSNYTFSKLENLTKMY